MVVGGWGRNVVHGPGGVLVMKVMLLIMKIYVLLFGPSRDTTGLRVTEGTGGTRRTTTTVSNGGRERLVVRVTKGFLTKVNVTLATNNFFLGEGGRWLSREESERRPLSPYLFFCT